jgi:hypothetical protein
VLQPERAVAVDVGADLFGVGEHLINGRPCLQASVFSEYARGNLGRFLQQGHRKNQQTLAARIDNREFKSPDVSKKFPVLFES